MLSNAMPVTEPVPPCQVLILSPLSDSLMTALRTVMLETHAWELCTPRLPMLQKINESNLVRHTEREFSLLVPFHTKLFIKKIKNRGKTKVQIQ